MVKSVHGCSSAHACARTQNREIEDEPGLTGPIVCRLPVNGVDSCDFSEDS